MVGMFVLMVSAALVVLAVKVSGLTVFMADPGYIVTAVFDDVGGLKVKAPIKMSGVKIGEVAAINLDPVTFKAKVTLYIFAQYNAIPSDSSASILTLGLLGDNYIAIVPMYSTQVLKSGGVIADTNSALILEQLLGRLLFKFGGADQAAVK
jgi:phospholipid/cholesterol/gamma-HCH transport system substrate-binding protein